MDSSGQAVEARRPPLGEALKQLHHAMTQLEENGAALEAKLGPIIARGPEVATAGSLHLSGGANRMTPMQPPERPRAEMTMELTELVSRVRQAAERLRNITHSLDC